jgi:hypothetical protein
MTTKTYVLEVLRKAVRDHKTTKKLMKKYNLTYVEGYDPKPDEEFLKRLEAFIKSEENR